MLRRTLQILIPVLILMLSVGGALLISKNKKPPRKRPPPKEKSQLVRVLPAQMQSVSIVVTANATTESSGVLNLSSEIKGKVTWVNPALVEGGWVTKGDQLVKINAVEYQLRADQAKSNLTKAEYELALIVAKQQAVEKEQKMLKNIQSKLLSQLNEDLSSLAKYEPQMKNAKVGLESAAAGLKEAQLNLGRTVIKAPFSGYLRMVSLVEGQVISAGQKLAEIVREKPIILKVAIPFTDLERIQMDEHKMISSGEGSPAVISKKIGNRRHAWQGIVKRQLQEVDALSRMATVIVEVEEPTSNYGLSLPIGLFVDVSIKGQDLHHLVAIPHAALRSNSAVWLVSANHRLEFRKVVTEWQDKENYYLSGGVEAGDRIITSAISTAAKGMKLKIYDEKSRSAGSKRLVMNPRRKSINSPAESGSQLGKRSRNTEQDEQRKK